VIKITTNNKIKNLIPSLREKKRYIAIKMIKNNSHKDIRNCLKEYNGVFGVSEMNLSFVKLNDMKIDNWCVVRVSPQSVDKVKASLCFLDNASVEKVSGSLKKIKMFVS